MGKVFLIKKDLGEIKEHCGNDSLQPEGVSTRPGGIGDKSHLDIFSPLSSPKDMRLKQQAAT